MGSFQWKLADFLAEREMSAYELASEVGVVSRTATIYRLAKKGFQPKAVQFDVIADILEALERRTGEPVQLTDILEYRRDAGSN